MNINLTKLKIIKIPHKLRVADKKIVLEWENCEKVIVVLWY